MTSSSSRTPSRFQSSRMRRTPRSASTSGVVTTTHLGRHLGRDRGRLGRDGADVDDGQRVARLDGAEHVAGDGGVDVLGLARPPRAPAAAGSRPCACRASPAGGARRSRRRRRRGRRRCAGAACPAARGSRPSGGRSRPGRPAGPGAIRAAARPRCSATVVVPTPPLAPRDGDQLAAERAAGRLLAGHAVAHRPRPLRGGADAGLEGLERQRQRDDVAQAGLHRRAQQPGRVVGGEQDQRRPRGTPAASSRARSSTGVPPSASCSSTTSTSSRRSARCSSSGSIDDVDDLELGLARLRGGAAGGLVVGDGDQQPRAHPSSPLRRRLRVARRGRSSRRACARRRVARRQQREPDVVRRTTRVRDLAAPGAWSART